MFQTPDSPIHLPSRPPLHTRTGYKVSHRHGFSLVELMISIALLSLLSIITVQGMIFHSRTAQSNLTKQKIAEGARRLVQGAQIAMMDPTVVTIGTGPSGAGTVLTIARPDPADSTKVLYQQYAYLDRDNNPATIVDNVVVERDTNTPMATTGKVLVEYASKVTGKNVFTQVGNAAHPLYELNLRLGDRTNPPTAADNGVTGRGYQSFLVSAYLAKGA